MYSYHISCLLVKQFILNHLQSLNIAGQSNFALQFNETEPSQNEE